jgi:hypothetical protein
MLVSVVNSVKVGIFSSKVYAGAFPPLLSS